MISPRLVSSPNREAIEGKWRRGEPSRLRKNYCDTSDRMLEQSVQQGRRRVETGGVPSGADGATTKERQLCAHRQVCEAAGPPLRFSMSRERSWRAFSAFCRY